MTPNAATIRSFFDPATATATHVVADLPARRAAVIDSVLDYDPHAGRTSTASADAVIDWLRAHELAVDWLLETHAHADHLSAAPYLQQRVGGRIGVGARIRAVQQVFRGVFGDAGIAVDGSPFDALFDDGARLAIGTLEVEVMHTPGHTPACVSYAVRSAGGLDVFVGDTLFMPDCGSARCDFPGGDAATLYDSARRLLALPPDTRLHLCHDYPPAGRAPQTATTVDAQRSANIHLRDGVDRAEFVARRHARDAGLALPALMLPAVQVNVRAGRLPEAQDNGRRYLKIPLNAF